jgi:uncharacterized protein
LYQPQTWCHPCAVSREMTVTGNGEIDAQPDYVEIQIEVRTQGEDVSQAQQQNAAIMNRVINSLLALNIPRENIQTTVYTISPNYDYIEGRQVFRGYEVQNAITVKITDISQAGLVIDTAIQNGANHVSAIQFKIEDSDAYYQTALNLALVNAIAKAKSMADTMHVPLQPIPIEIMEESQNVTPILYKSVQLSNQELSTPIEQGRITITASVRVKFRY